VQVENGLSGSGTDVEHGAVAILDAALSRDVGGSQLASADQVSVLSRSLLQSANVLLGNDQHVRGGLRIDIFERVGMLVLVNLFGRNFSTNDAAEQTVVHDTVHRFEIGDTPRCSAVVAGRGRRVPTIPDRSENCSAVVGSLGHALKTPLKRPPAVSDSRVSQ